MLSEVERQALEARCSSKDNGLSEVEGSLGQKKERKKKNEK